MTNRTRSLLDQALALADDERADLAAHLLASLDDVADDDAAAVRAAWATELERRARQALASEAPVAEWHDVRSQARARLTPDR